jgi:Mrp family chromosome partitioning ATPase
MSQPTIEALRGVFRAFSNRQSDGALRVMFISAARGEGVSTLSRQAAALCAQRATRAVLLVDLDLLRDSQYRWYQASKIQVHPAIDGRLKGACFFRALGPDGVERAGIEQRLKLAQIGKERLFVSHFDTARLEPDTRLQVLSAPTYWDNARDGCDFVVVDAPALSRSRVGLSVAAHIDGVVIVTSGERGSADLTLALKEELEQRGARLLGVIYTDADPSAARIEHWLKRFA